MDKADKIYRQAKSSPNNIRFNDLCLLAERAGFVFDHPNGSHKFFKHSIYKDVIMNFQNVKGKAKPYQVRQLIDFIDRHELLGR
ncbi:MAG: type II toxin-antitoxin system HicA family toxin [Syntrophaceae bacterium]|nr:type II toxin-antitoxin system HicA family toxin [Syntrophaceae bacterium]